MAALHLIQGPQLLYTEPYSIDTVHVGAHTHTLYSTLPYFSIIVLRFAVFYTTLLYRKE